MFVVLIKYWINFTSDKRFGLPDIYREFCRQLVGISVTSGFFLWPQYKRLWMYGRGTGYRCTAGEQAVDVREGNRLWMYGRETGCGCTGGEQAVDVREGNRL
jgi:hypothetical protein